MSNNQVNFPSLPSETSRLSSSYTLASLTPHLQTSHVNNLLLEHSRKYALNLYQSAGNIVLHNYSNCTNVGGAFNSDLHNYDNNNANANADGNEIAYNHIDTNTNTSQSSSHHHQQQPPITLLNLERRITPSTLNLAFSLRTPNSVSTSSSFSSDTPLPVDYTLPLKPTSRISINTSTSNSNSSCRSVNDRPLPQPPSRSFGITLPPKKEFESFNSERARLGGGNVRNQRVAAAAAAASLDEDGNTVVVVQEKKKGGGLTKAEVSALGQVDYTTSGAGAGRDFDVVPTATKGKENAKDRLYDGNYNNEEEEEDRDDDDEDAIEVDEGEESDKKGKRKMNDVIKSVKRRKVVDVFQGGGDGDGDDVSGIDL